MLKLVTLYSGLSDACLQTPIPGIVLSYRLSRSLRGWHPGHQELARSASDGSLSHEHHQPQQQQQEQQPDSEYGTIAKFAGTSRTSLLKP